MRKSMTHPLALVALAAFSLLACGDPEPDAEPQPPSDSVPQTTAAPSTSFDLVVHMTGALVMVPAGSSGMNVLLPQDRQGLPHIARFGFGIEKNNPEGYPCVDDPVFTNPPISGKPPTEEGICYVDLKDWEVLDLGASGTPSPAVQTLPAGVLDVSLLSRRHKATHPTQDALATVRLATGGPGVFAEDQCSLATWTYEWTDEQGAQQTDTRELINVLSWRIKDPAREFRLRSRTGLAEHTVQLPAPEPGKNIELILAHVPMKDLGHLPPGPEAELEKLPPPRADHIDLYYDLLRHPSTGKRPPPADRRIPHTPQPVRGKACPVAITTSAERFLQPSSVATYACMIGRGEG